MTMPRMLAILLVAACALSTGPAGAAIKSQWVEYTHGGTKLKAYMVYDDAVKRHSAVRGIPYTRFIREAVGSALSRSAKAR